MSWLQIIPRCRNKISFMNCGNVFLHMSKRLLEIIAINRPLNEQLIHAKLFLTCVFVRSWSDEWRL